MYFKPPTFYNAGPWRDAGWIRDDVPAHLLVEILKKTFMVTQQSLQ